MTESSGVSSVGGPSQQVGTGFRLRKGAGRFACGGAGSKPAPTVHGGDSGTVLVSDRRAGRAASMTLAAIRYNPAQGTAAPDSAAPPGFAAPPFSARTVAISAFDCTVVRCRDQGLSLECPCFAMADFAAESRPRESDPRRGVLRYHGSPAAGGSRGCPSPLAASPTAACS